MQQATNGWFVLVCAAGCAILPPRLPNQNSKYKLYKNV